MRLMGIATAWRSDTWLLIIILTIAALLFAFCLTAQEVIEGELLVFDATLMSDRCAADWS